MDLADLLGIAIDDDTPPNLPDDLPSLRQAIKDGYRIDPEGRLGEGGCGVAYAAHIRETDVPVCVKAHKPMAGIDVALSAQLLRDEFVLVRDRLSGPRVEVAKALGFGGTGAATYAVFAWIEAESVTRWAHRGKLKPAERLALCERVLQSVAAVHEAGVVHGDLKPEHLLTPDGEKVVVIDFGAAYHIDDEESMDGAPVLAGVTHEWAAPEQTDGAGTLAARGSMAADVYTLAKILRAILGGDDTGLAIGPSVPRWCRQTLAAMSGSHPDERCRTAGEALLFWHEAKAAHTRVRRRWWAARAVAAVVFLVAVVGAFGVWSGRPGQYAAVYRPLLEKAEVQPTTLTGGLVTVPVRWPLENTSGQSAAPVWQTATNDAGGDAEDETGLAFRIPAVFDTGPTYNPSRTIACRLDASGRALIAWVEGDREIRVFNEATGQRWRWQSSHAIHKLFLADDSALAPANGHPNQPGFSSGGKSEGEGEGSVLGVVHVNNGIHLLRLAEGGGHWRLEGLPADVTDARLRDGVLWAVTEPHGGSQGRLTLWSAGLADAARDGRLSAAEVEEAERVWLSEVETSAAVPLLGQMVDGMLSVEPLGETGPASDADDPVRRFPVPVNSGGSMAGYHAGWRFGDRWTVWLDLSRGFDTPPTLWAVEHATGRRYNRRLGAKAVVGAELLLEEAAKRVWVATESGLVRVSLGPGLPETRRYAIDRPLRIGGSLFPAGPDGWFWADASGVWQGLDSGNPVSP